ncbi:protein-L-isoaspartate(D-aspartate) O-methyltransferase [Actinobacteria bacterium OK074]|nr:protein-L-isoaspartate(D-aspartate) O-methyltransferase [Actinobacteria bacterium OK074]
MTPTELPGERSELGRSLLERKILTSDWMPSFAAVPRTAFLPDLMWPFDMDTGTTLTVDRRQDPDRWQQYADMDVPIVTQWDDGANDGPGTVPTSSASMPSVVFRMLRDLDVEPGQRILEIGTGTGWNAALLTHRLGLKHTTSIEIDPNMAHQARARLAAQGLLSLVLTGDGTLGDPVGAPYDRIIATAGLRRIPGAWLEQVAPGGVILAPFGTHYSNADSTVRLTVGDRGEAQGHFTGPVEFMKLRGQRLLFHGHAAYLGDGMGGAARSTTKVTEEELLGEGRFESRTFAIGLRVRGCHHTVANERDGSRPVWFYGLGDDSWACVMFHDGREADVWQGGPRKLWDEVSEALGWWRAADEPGVERFGLTVARDGRQRAWLDSPDDDWPL